MRMILLNATPKISYAAKMRISKKKYYHQRKLNCSLQSCMSLAVSHMMMKMQETKTLSDHLKGKIITFGESWLKRFCIEDVITRKRFSCSFSQLYINSPLNFNESRKLANIWQIARVGIIVMTFETGWIHYRDFGSEDGDGNDKVKKPIGLIRKTTTASHASRIFVNFFVVTARLRSENGQFHFS